MKEILLSIIKAKIFQPLWKKLHHLSLIGMNYWGGSNINKSGEIPAIRYVFSRLKTTNAELVIFDVGANAGGYLTALNNNAPPSKCRIYSFEPSTIAFSILEKTKKNLLNVSVTTFNFGFSNKNENVELFTPYSGASIASVYSLRNPLREFKDEFSEVIKLSTIDNFCCENNIETIDFLKIDVEGHELKVLQGAMKMIQAKKIKFIQFEFGDCNIESKAFMRDFYDILAGSYRLFRILPKGLSKMPPLYRSDVEIFATVNFLAELT